MKRAFSFALLALVLIACDDDTTGRRITLGTTASGGTSPRFTTGFGWDVTLTKAAVATAGLYYFDGPPPTALWNAPRKKGWSDYFIKSAWAHPGHYQAGTALGEAIFAAPIAIDVLAAAPATLPNGDGITGTYRSARLVLPQIETPIAVAEGTATKDGAVVAFRLVADYADVSASITNGAVDGCVLDEAVVATSGTVHLEVVPKVWLNLVDFSKIAPAPAEAHEAGFSQGVTQLSAYHFTYSAGTK
jgi:hypothetical protein